MAYVLSNVHVNDDVTWAPKVWGSTVGYPSDSLASCLVFSHSLGNFVQSWDF